MSPRTSSKGRYHLCALDPIVEHKEDEDDREDESEGGSSNDDKDLTKEVKNLEALISDLRHRVDCLDGVAKMSCPGEGAAGPDEASKADTKAPASPPTTPRSRAPTPAPSTPPKTAILARLTTQSGTRPAATPKTVPVSVQPARPAAPAAVAGQLDLAPLTIIHASGSLMPYALQSVLQAGVAFSQKHGLIQVQNAVEQINVLLGRLSTAFPDSKVTKEGKAAAGTTFSDPRIRQAMYEELRSRGRVIYDDEAI